MFHSQNYKEISQEGKKASHTHTTPHSNPGGLSIPSALYLSISGMCSRLKHGRDEKSCISNHSLSTRPFSLHPCLLAGKVLHPFKENHLYSFPVSSGSSLSLSLPLRQPPTSTSTELQTSTTSLHRLPP